MTSQMDRAIRLRQEEDRRFWQMLSASVGLHGIFAAVISLWTWIVPAEATPHFDPPIQVDLISISPSAGSPAPRKASGLPDKATFVPQPEESTVPEEVLKAPKDKTDKTPEKLPEDKTQVKPAKTDGVREASSLEDAMKKDPPKDPGLAADSLESLNRIAALQRARLVASRHQGAEGTVNRDATSPDGVAGGGAGTGRGGGGGNGAGLDARWADALSSKVQENWTLLPTLVGKNLEVQIYVKVDSEGTVTRAEIERSSSNSSFDQLALRAVKKSSPLPMPDRAEIRKLILADGFGLKFNPKGMVQR